MTDNKFEYEPMPKDLKVYREKVWGTLQLQTKILIEQNHEGRIRKVEGDITKVKIAGATLTGLATIVFGFGKSIIKALH